MIDTSQMQRTPSPDARLPSARSTRSASRSPVPPQTSTPAASAKPLTPTEYFLTLQSHSNTTAKDTLYVGESFQALVAFLRRSSLIDLVSPTSPTNTSTTTASRPDDFTLCYILKNLKDSPKPRFLPSPLSDLSSVSPNGKSGGVLVFLMGYPSPDRILQLGAAYHIDPEFFRLHLGLSNRLGEQLYDFPRLPSYRKSLFQIHITSIGKRRVPVYSTIQRRRERAEEMMRQYIKSMKDSPEWKLGDSIVREYAEHDASSYSIQQTVTVCLCKPRRQQRKNEEDWMCLVWLDSGRDLSCSPKGPWNFENGSQTHFLPTKSYKPGVSLKNHENTTALIPAPNPGTASQSISLLPFAYGKSLNPSAMCLDPLYALNELFTFAAQSENTFLIFLEGILGRNLEQISTSPAKSLLDLQADLIYHRSILGKHVEQLRDTTDLLKSRADLDWPKYREGQASTATRWLERDYEHILRRAIQLQQRCEREMDILMNTASLEEAKASAKQASRVTKLTVLASFFIPMSFSTSIFGMNFVEFSQAGSGVWVWVVVTVGLLGGSYVILHWNQSRVNQALRSVAPKKRANELSEHKIGV